MAMSMSSTAPPSELTGEPVKLRGLTPSLLVCCEGAAGLSAALYVPSSSAVAARVAALCAMR